VVPEKQGLKPETSDKIWLDRRSISGGSRKTRIETYSNATCLRAASLSISGGSRKTRIET